MSYYSKDVYLAQTAGNDQWDVTFPYADQSEVSVFVDGVSVTFTWVNSGRIKIDTALTQTSTVVVERNTDLATRKVDFVDTAEITEADLDNSNIQLYHAMQEAIDNARDVMSVATNNEFDAGGKVIDNIADPVDDDDAVTKGWAIANLDSGAAATSAGQAATSATHAAEWANKAEDSLVSAAAGGNEVDDYSALHHAAKAAASAAAAEASNQASNAAERFMPFFKSNGASDRIDLIGTTLLPFKDSAGADKNISMVV